MFWKIYRKVVVLIVFLGYAFIMTLAFFVLFTGDKKAMDILEYIFLIGK